jgi:hypothetical protein
MLGQPMFFLVIRTFSTPSASPWAFSESCLGLPNPMCVRVTMSVGRSGSDCASPIAASIWSRSFTSPMWSTCHPYASNRFAVSSVNVRSVEPSIVMWLSEMRFGHSQSHCVADALSQGPGRGLDACGLPVLRVARRSALPLPELPDVVERQIVAAEVEAGVEQHRRMAARQDEPIAILPMRIGGIVPHDAQIQHLPQGRERHGRARMPGVRFLDRVHGERTNGIDAEKFEVAIGLCSVRGRETTPALASES